ncbi:hypothetical protein ACFVGN_33885 [Streptomyces sp. NPDC057757]|uniref:hypothetical protein n=1 Tax=Streptomyces sp. NPDC057757 TaxID=3346241 RepID=UPI0036939448
MDDDGPGAPCREGTDRIPDPAETELPDNWDRWRADDELGTPNLITDELWSKTAANDAPAAIGSSSK